jgi:hypothetical protein
MARGRRLNKAAAGTYNTLMGPTCSPFELWRDGVPAWPALPPTGLRACVAAAALLLAAPDFGADDFPPPIAPQVDPGTTAAPAAATGAPATAAPVVASNPEPAPPRAEHDARIEQKRVGRRVSELIVTPAGFTYHYSIIHLDDQDPGTTPLQPHPELSVPRFFRIDF